MATELSDQLPEGMTCGNCVHFERCNMLFNCNAENTNCDWSPSKFFQIKKVFNVQARLLRGSSGWTDYGNVSFEFAANEHAKSMGFKTARVEVREASNPIRSRMFTVTACLTYSAKEEK